MLKKECIKIIEEVKKGGLKDEHYNIIEGLNTTNLKKLEGYLLDYKVDENELLKELDNCIVYQLERNLKDSKKVASVKLPTKKEEVKEEVKEDKKSSKKPTKKETKKTSKKTTKKEGAKEEIKKEPSKVDISTLAIEDITKHFKKSAKPLNYEQIENNSGIMLMTSKEYGVERIRVIDKDTTEDGERYVLIKSLDNKGVYDFIHVSDVNNKGVVTLVSANKDKTLVTIYSLIAK